MLNKQEREDLWLAIALAGVVYRHEGRVDKANAMVKLNARLKEELYANKEGEQEEVSKELEGDQADDTGQSQSHVRGESDVSGLSGEEQDQSSGDRIEGGADSGTLGSHTREQRAEQPEGVVSTVSPDIRREASRGEREDNAQDEGDLENAGVSDEERSGVWRRFFRRHRGKDKRV